jgi:hypothetical protein
MVGSSLIMTIDQDPASGFLASSTSSRLVGMKVVVSVVRCLSLVIKKRLPVLPIFKGFYCKY